MSFFLSFIHMFITYAHLQEQETQVYGQINYFF